MRTLRDYQFELLPEEDSPLDGALFGLHAPVAVNEGGFTAGDRSWATQDAFNNARGTKHFGRDVIQPTAWAWAAHVDAEEEETALATLSEFSRAWGPPRIQGWEPGEHRTIRYQIGQRVRRVYGRPRRWARSLTNEFISGKIPVNFDFELADRFHYDDELSISDTIVWTGPDSEGGFILPTTLPIESLPGDDASAPITVGGDAPTYPMIHLEGPLPDPTVATAAWTLNFRNVSLGAGDYLDVDLRPWHMTAILNGTASVAGRIGRRTRLEDLYLEPGNHEIVLRGSGFSGGGSCRVSWRNAWTEL